MGTVNCCEQPKEGLIERGEIETNLDFEKSVNEKFIKTPKSNNTHILKPKVFYDLKTNNVMKIQAILRSFNLKAKFKKRLEYQTKSLKEFFQTQGVLCEKDDINFYVHPKIKRIERMIKNKEGIYNNEHIPTDIFKKIENQVFYSIEMPCTYLIEKEEKHVEYKGNNIEPETSNTDNVLSENEGGVTILKRPVYKGYWNINKKKNGFGILVNTDGSKYEGTFRNGKLEGLGRYITIVGDFFEGNFINGSANGYGIFIHSDGSIYKGNWKNDLPWGDGEEWSFDGSYYKGDFLQGKKCGIGEFRWKDGSIYLGGVNNDLLNGEGIYSWADGKRYKGLWKDNEMYGKGVLENIDGSKYDGVFVKNKKQGYGKYYYNKDKYYEGEWFNGKQHGKGKLVKNNIVEEGIWDEGKRLKDEI